MRWTECYPSYPSSPSIARSRKHQHSSAQHKSSHIVRSIFKLVAEKFKRFFLIVILLQDLVGSPDVIVFH